MKKIVLSIVALISICNYNAQTWEFHTPPIPQAPRVAKDLEIVSNTNILMGLNDGNSNTAVANIRKYANLGWYSLQLNIGLSKYFGYNVNGVGLDAGIQAISFPNLTNGWAVWNDQPTNTVNIVSSIDAGENWVIQSTSGGWASDIKFLDNLNGYVLLENAVLKTTDGGINWQNYTIAAGLKLTKFEFLDVNTGWAVGATTGTINTVIYKTIDGGLNWTLQGPTVANQSFNRIFMLDVNNGWVVGSGGLIYNTSNGGTTWTAQTSGTTNVLKSVYFADNSKGWAVGFNKVLETIDGGTTWTTLAIGATDDNIDIEFYGTTGIILNSFGGTLKLCPDYNLTVNYEIQYSPNGYQWGNHNIYQSGQYFYDFASITQCDSNVTANFIVRDTDTLITITTCENPFIFNGNTYTSSTYTQFVLPNGSVFGFDSTIVLDLTIYPSIDINGISTDGFTLGTNNISNGSYQWIDCNNGNSVINGETSYTYAPTNSGEYAVIISNGQCTDTTICAAVCPASLSYDATSLIVDADAGSLFNWIDCIEDEYITGETSSTYTPTVTGEYAVVVENSTQTCSVYIDCIEFTIGGGNPSSINEQELNNISIYPNPANSIVSVSNVTIGSTVTIIDVMGKRVYATKAVNTTVDLLVENLSNGIYFIEIENNGAVAQKKLVVSK